VPVESVDPPAAGLGDPPRPPVFVPELVPSEPDTLSPELPLCTGVVSVCDRLVMPGFAGVELPAPTLFVEFVAAEVPAVEELPPIELPDAPVPAEEPPEPPDDPPPDCARTSDGISISVAAIVRNVFNVVSCGKLGLVPNRCGRLWHRAETLLASGRSRSSKHPGTAHDGGRDQGVAGPPFDAVPGVLDAPALLVGPLPLPAWLPAVPFWLLQAESRTTVASATRVRVGIEVMRWSPLRW